MSKKDLLLQPIKIDKKTWYYEEPGGISIIHEIWKSGEYWGVYTINISWQKLKKSLARLTK